LLFEAEETKQFSDHPKSFASIKMNSLKINSLANHLVDSAESACAKGIGNCFISVTRPINADHKSPSHGASRDASFNQQGADDM